MKSCFFAKQSERNNQPDNVERSIFRMQLPSECPYFRYLLTNGVAFIAAALNFHQEESE